MAIVAVASNPCARGPCYSIPVRCVPGAAVGIACCKDCTLGLFVHTGRPRVGRPTGCNGVAGGVRSNALRDRKLQLGGSATGEFDCSQYRDGEFHCVVLPQRGIVPDQIRKRAENFLATKTVAVEIAIIAITGRLAVEARVNTYVSNRNRSYGPLAPGRIMTLGSDGIDDQGVNLSA